MSKRLRDGGMCIRLQIHSQWMMKTHWFLFHCVHCISIYVGCE